MAVALPWGATWQALVIWSVARAVAQWHETPDNGE